jgi:hypothetical protein
MLFREAFDGGLLFFEDLNRVEKRLDFFGVNFLHSWINLTNTFDFGVCFSLNEFVLIDNFLFFFEIRLEMCNFELELIDELCFSHVLKNVLIYNRNFSRRQVFQFGIRLIQYYKHRT